MITDVKRERVAMTREEAITIMQLYKDELAHRIAKIDYDIREIDLYSIHLDAFEVAIEALSAEAEPTVIRCKTLLNAEDFEAVATRIRKENRNVIVIPCETEVASAEAVIREGYNETDGVIEIEKQSAKDVGEIKHIVIRSPNYTRYFYNESMPISAEAAQGEWKRVEINGYQYAVCDQCHLLADMVEKDGKLVMSMANADDEYANFCPNCGAKMTKGGDSE